MKTGQALIDKWPKLFVEAAMTPFESCMGRGIECWEGWFPLLDKLCEHLQNISDSWKNQIIFKQVKSKFAHLTVYWVFEHPEKVTDFDKGMIVGIISAYSGLSADICEVCGRPGKRVNSGSWTYAECPECTETRKKLGPCWHMDKEKVQQSGITIYQMMFGEDDEQTSTTQDKEE
jgi:hypothetical protein